jgi:hypothetical protein
VHLDDPSKEGMVSLPTLQMKSRLCPYCCCCPPLCGSLGRFLSLSPQYSTRVMSCWKSRPKAAYSLRYSAMSSACVAGLCAIGICAATGAALWKLGNNGRGIPLAEVYVRVVTGVYCLPMSSHALHVGLECPKYLS